MAEVYTVYIFPLVLYCLPVLLPKNHRLALQRSLSKLLWRGQGRWSVDRSVVNVRVMRIEVCLIWRTTGSLKDWLTWADPCRRTQYGGERRARLFLAFSRTPRLKVDVSRRAKHRLSSNTVRLFATSQGPVTFLGLERNCIGI